MMNKQRGIIMLDYQTEALKKVQKVQDCPNNDKLMRNGEQRNVNTMGNRK